MSMKCLGVEACGKCLDACTAHRITPGGLQQKKRMVKIDGEQCSQCGKCAQVCAPGALYMSGRMYTLEEIMTVLRRDQPFYEKSGGGVTLSGGECLCQPEFSLELLKAAKAEGIHTAVDTTGFASPEVLRAIAPYTDLFLYDIKHMDSQKHEAVVGVPNERILQNAVLLHEMGKKIQVRIPVIPGFNDSDDNILKTGQFCKRLGTSVTSVQLLPYHSYGSSKYDRIFKKYSLKHLEAPSDERMNVLKEMLKALGLEVTIH